MCIYSIVDLFINNNKSSSHHPHTPSDDRQTTWTGNDSLFKSPIKTVKIAFLPLLLQVFIYVVLYDTSY